MDGVTEYKEIKPGTEAEQSFLTDATEAWTQDLAFEGEAREKMHYDISFEAGRNHWEGLESLRTNRPSLVIPRANAFLNQVRNENRQNKPSIKISPRGAVNQQIAKQRVKAAKRRQDLIRGIQYESNAQDAYQLGFDFMVGPGRGWWQAHPRLSD